MMGETPDRESEIVVLLARKAAIKIKLNSCYSAHGGTPLHDQYFLRDLETNLKELSGIRAGLRNLNYLGVGC
jgi:hypothetical protein